MAEVSRIRKVGSRNLDDLTVLLDVAFDRALARQSHVSTKVLKMNGMSGICYRMFINNLVRIVADARYLEVGSWAGSTVCSAMDKNVLKATCIDNWSQFEGPKAKFEENVKSVLSKNIEFNFIENDFRSVDVSVLGKNNIYLFDGPHEEQDQYDGLQLYDIALEDEIFFIVDDWNWNFVRKGTLRAIAETGWIIDYAIDIRSTDDNTHPTIAMEHSDWHNGYFLSKIRRRNAYHRLIF